MEYRDNTAQENLEKRIAPAKKIEDIGDSMTSSDTEPSAKIEDAKRIEVLKTELNKLIAEHDSL